VFFDGMERPLIEALDTVSRTSFDPARIRASAERFSQQRHVTQMRAIIEETLAAPAERRW
jgi:hypothetical protein